MICVCKHLQTFANICKLFCDCLDRSSPSLQLLLTFSPYSPGANITCEHVHCAPLEHIYITSTSHIITSQTFLAHVCTCQSSQSCHISISPISTLQGSFSWCSCQSARISRIFEVWAFRKLKCLALTLSHTFTSSLFWSMCEWWSCGFVDICDCEGCKSHLNMGILGSQTFDAGDEEQILIEDAIRQDIVKPPTATRCHTIYATLSNLAARNKLSQKHVDLAWSCLVQRLYHGSPKDKFVLSESLMSWLLLAVHAVLHPPDVFCEVGTSGVADWGSAANHDCCIVSWVMACHGMAWLMGHGVRSPR